MTTPADRRAIAAFLAEHGATEVPPGQRTPAAPATPAPVTARTPEAPRADRAHHGPSLPAMERLERKARIPDGVAPDDGINGVSPAVARGRIHPFKETEVVQTRTGSVVRNVTRHGARPAMAEDAFHRMARQTRTGAPFFEEGHALTGRAYAALTERVACAGVKCTSLEAQTGGGDGRGSFIDSVIADSRLLDFCHQRIGDGVALRPRRVLAQADRGRRPITTRAVVDAVCLGLVHGRPRGVVTISDLLFLHHWGRGPKAMKAAQAALLEALDGLMGLLVS